MPDLRTRSRLHHWPASVLSISGRNQTSGACGTQTRSSSGTARTAISLGASRCVVPVMSA